MLSGTVSPAKARRPREHLVEDAAESPNVAALIDGLPPRVCSGDM